MRAGAVALLVAVGGFALSASGAAAVTLEPCRSKVADCHFVTVPLDRSGVVAGTVRLRLDVSRSDSPEAAPLLAIGGAPGEAGTSALSVSAVAGAIVAGFEGPRGRGARPSLSRDVLTMDLRGTGRSGALFCRDLQRQESAPSADAAAACATQLGARRGLYTARDSADDVEAVRQALGVEKIALIGVSHGARVVLAYAQRYPDRVDRLLLQSPPPPEGADLLYRSRFAAVPAVVAARCAAGTCRRASRTPVDDVVELARRLERGPLAGSVVDRSGRRRTLRIDAFDLVRALGGTETLISLATFVDLPALVRNARRGDIAPLLRARESLRWYREVLSSRRASRFVSAAANAASICEESAVPWPRTAAPEDRGPFLSALVAGLPPTAFDPFGPRSALQSDLVELCRKWPVASAPPDPVPVLPAIPTLILSGKEDLTSPRAHADAVSGLIPGSRVLAVPGSDSELDIGLGDCVSSAVEAFFSAREAPGRCGPPSFRPRSQAPAPLSLEEVRPEAGFRGRRGRTLAAVRLTLRDGAQAIPTSFFTRLAGGQAPGRPRVRLYGPPVRSGALRAGTYALAFRPRRFVLRNASYVPGVRVSGTLAPLDADTPSRLRGYLRVRGTAAAQGRLTVRGRIVTGSLGGSRVRMSIGGEAYPDITFGR